MYEKILEKIQEGDLTAVKALVTENNYDVNTPAYYESEVYGDKHPRCPLIIVATRKQNYDLVKFLLEKGANVNAIDNDNEPELDEWSQFPNGTNDSPLTAATKHSNSDIVELLLSYGADVKHFNEYNMTAIESVLLWYPDQKEMIHSLLKYGSYINLSDEHVIFNEHVRSYIAINKLKSFKQDLMASTWHPKRLESWLEHDRVTTGDEHCTKTLDMMLGV
jgi:hypothetical protein